MSDFHQNGFVPTLHDLGQRSTQSLEEELKLFSGYRPMELILPSLYSELAGPALSGILEQISQVDYLNHIIVGLDQADGDQCAHAMTFFADLGQPYTLLWNDGPRLQALHAELRELNLGPAELGKGYNVWYCLGMILARGKAEAVALHDCDILTYDRHLLARLFYPVANPAFQFEFCKGYYPRIADNRLNGRVSRLLVGPLLEALERTLGPDEYFDFMKSFRYPLAGEFSFSRSLLPELRIPFDWGLELGVLSEVHRNQASNRICQVDIAGNYDHKHQALSPDDATRGLARMSIDISKVLIRKLATKGYVFNQETFRTLKACYYRQALDTVDFYRADAAINGLHYDLHREEAAIELFAKNILEAGQVFLESPLKAPFIPTWSRVLSARPDFLHRFRLAVQQDNKEMGNPYA